MYDRRAVVAGLFCLKLTVMLYVCLTAGTLRTAEASMLREELRESLPEAGMLCVCYAL